MCSPPSQPQIRIPVDTRESRDCEVSRRRRRILERHQKTGEEIHEYATKVTMAYEQRGERDYGAAGGGNHEGGGFGRGRGRRMFIFLHICGHPS